MKAEKKYEEDVKEFVKKAVKVFFMVAIVILFAFLIGYVVMLLWNWLMPSIFGLTTIGYWQAIGLLALAKILFGLGNHSSKGKGMKQKRKRKMEEWCKSRNSFSDWKHYDNFWKEEGEAAYKAYVERMENEKPNEEV
ncbi:hypothetical protein [Flagellimonas sp.]|uniref:hypothetical protein n=1 Tax=Flagellimonas sp. TaxID=2058762 RepID=UPI003F49DA33